MKTVIRLLSAAGFVVTALVRVTDPLLPAIAQDFGTAVADTAIIITTYALAYGLFQLLYGPLGDRVGKLKVIGGALAFTAIGTTACAFAKGIVPLAILRFATGMTSAAVIPLSLAFFGDQVSYDKRQVTIGRYIGSLMMGQIFGASLSGVLAEYVSWRVVFILIGAAALIIAIPIHIAARRFPSPSTEEAGRTSLFDFSGYLHLLSCRPVFFLMSAVFTEGIFSYGGFAFLGAELRSHWELSFLAIGGILSSFGFGGIAYSMCVSWFVRRLGERRMLAVGSTAVALCYIIFSYIPSWKIVFVFLFMIGFAFYMFHNTYQTLATELTPDKRGVTLSLFSFSLYLGQGIGVTLLGRIVAHAGYHVMFPLSGLGVLALGLWSQARLGDMKNPETAGGATL